LNVLAIEDFKKALPAGLKKSVNPELVTKINETLKDPDTYEMYRENLLSYTSVMKNGRFKVSGYIDAVKYCSQRLMGKTCFESFSITFPEKIERWTLQLVEPKDMASYVTAFNKSKMVTLIMEQSLIPTHILNQDIHQQAINAQAYLMLNAKSEKVRSDAANSLLTHLKSPETQKIELNVSTKEDSSIAALHRSTMELVAMQKDLVKSGVMNAQEVAHSAIVIEGEFTDAE
jgi:hypothetical protein